MTSKHATPEWRRTVRLVKAQARRTWEQGGEVTCWRTGRVIPGPDQLDVGHIDPHGGEGLDNAAPELRRVNRSHGGKLGAQITNARKSTKNTFRPLPWA